MKFLLFLTVTAVFAASFDREDDDMEELAEGMSPYGDLDEDEFLEVFNLPPIDDPEEKALRAEALKAHEQEVLENNEAFLAGNQTWFDEINEYSDLPDDEFEANHTGAHDNMEYARGLKDIPLPYDEESERFFDAYRYDRSTVPASYNSVTLGNVSPVKSQGGDISRFYAKRPPILKAHRTSERQVIPLVGRFGCLELCLYGIRELA